MTEIPNILRRREFKFCLIQSKSKKPFEKDWANKGYDFDDYRLIKFLENGNYGVIGGYGNLRILDIDDKSKVEEFKEKFKDTYLVQSGSGGLHIYFISDYDINHVLQNGLGEFRAKNYQVVGCGSIHENGNEYVALNNKLIKRVSKEEMIEILKPYIKKSDINIQTPEKDNSRSGLEYRKAIALFRKGKTRAEVHKELLAYKKYADSPEQYKDLTLDKAELFVLEEQEKEKPKKEIQPTEEHLEILKNPKLLDIIDDELEKKVVGEHEGRKTIFMVCNMRNVENLGKATDNLNVNAKSGTGKDAVSEAVFSLIPEEEKEELIKTTPKVLAYTRNRKINPASTWKKSCLRLEDASNEVLNDDAFKVMSSANPNKVNRIKFVNKGIIQDVEIDGKPSIILTQAESNPKEELQRRYPICSMDEGINQTTEILKRQAEFAMIGKSIDYDDTIIQALKLLKRVKVKIPFADKLINIFCAENVIVRTHFQRFLDYIKSSASLYQYQRIVDDEGYVIAERQDYEIACLMLKKTTSNILMIPLTKIRSDILEVFEKKNLQNKSVDDLEELKEIEKLNISQEWLRKQLDWLVSKTFLLKSKERRKDEADKIIPKPVFVYSYNKLQKLVIPEWKELFSSITQNSKISSINTISSNTQVNEVNEVIYQPRETEKQHKIPVFDCRGGKNEIL